MSLTVKGDRIVIHCWAAQNDRLSVATSGDGSQLLFNCEDGDNASHAPTIVIDRAGAELLCRELLAWLHTYHPGPST